MSFSSAHKKRERLLYRTRRRVVLHKREVQSRAISAQQEAAGVAQANEAEMETDQWIEDGESESGAGVNGNGTYDGNDMMMGDQAEDEIYQNLLQNESIFISIASYRDPECPKTIEDLFTKARFPNRLVVGVCQQNLDNDLDCMTALKSKAFVSQVKVFRMSANDATGPGLARSIIEEKLFQDETFFLQIDSHMMFVPNWDVLFIEELLKCPTEKAVLTCYPPNFNRGQRVLPASPPLPYTLKFKAFHKSMKLVEIEPLQCLHKPSAPLRSLFWAAGCSFTYGAIVREVPYDPECPYLFLGEEISRAARMYTWGWDFYALTENLVYHIHSREYRPTFWEQFHQKGCVVDPKTRVQRKALERQSIERVMTLLMTGQINNPVYGFGNVRTLYEYEQYCGIDFQNKRHRPHAERGLVKEPTPEEVFCLTGQAPSNSSSSMRTQGMQGSQNMQSMQNMQSQSRQMSGFQSGPGTQTGRGNPNPNPNPTNGANNSGNGQKFRVPITVNRAGGYNPPGSNSWQPQPYSANSNQPNWVDNHSQAQIPLNFDPRFSLRKDQPDENIYMRQARSQEDQFQKQLARMGLRAGKSMSRKY